MLWMLLVGKDPRGICWDSLGTSASSWLPLLNLTFPVFSWRLELSDLSALSALPPHPFHSFRSLAICLGCASLVVVKDCRTLFSPEKLHSCQKSPPALSRRRRTWCQGTCICSTKQDELCMLGCVVRQFRWDEMPEIYKNICTWFPIRRSRGRSHSLWGVCRICFRLLAIHTTKDIKEVMAIEEVTITMIAT